MHSVKNGCAYLLAWLLAAGCGMVPLTAGASPDALLARAAQLRQAGNPAQAWSELQSREADYAGDPDFDMQLGLAAVEAGHPDHAVFAFERALQTRPWDQRVRLELARASYLSGNLTGARQYFEQVLASNPPAQVRQRIELFLSAIERAEQAQQRDTAAYVDLRFGHDSNVNSATTLQQIDIPALGVVTLSDAGRASSDNFMELSAGASLVQPFSRQYSLFADISVRDRENAEQHESNLRTLALSAGPSFTRPQQRLRLPITVQELYLDNDHFRQLVSIGPEWSHEIDAQNRLSLFAQYGVLRYPVDELRDARLAVGGASWTGHFKPRQLQLTGSLYIGDEQADHAAGDYNGRRYHGARVDAQWQAMPQHTPYLSLLGQWTGYDADNPVFLKTRDETYVEFKAGWRWQPQQDWSLYAEASHVLSNSNVSMFEYTRNQLSAGLRYLFD